MFYIQNRTNQCLVKIPDQKWEQLLWKQIKIVLMVLPLTFVGFFLEGIV